MLTQCTNHSPVSDSLETSPQKAARMRSPVELAPRKKRRFVFFDARMSARALATVCVVIVEMGCSKRDSGKPIEGASIEASTSAIANVASPRIAPHSIPRPEHAVAELAVLTSAPRSEIAKMIAPAFRAQLIESKRCGDKATCDAVRAFASDGARLAITVEKASEWGVPTGEALSYVASNMGAADREAIPKLASAIVISAHGTALPDQLPARAAFAITAAIAERLHAVVYDDVLRRIETSDAFAAHAITSPLGAPGAFRQDRIVVQLYRQDDGTARLLTLGMRRFGAADVEIEGAPDASGSSLARALGTIAEKLAAGAQNAPIRVGATDESEVGFTASPHHEGDPDNTFLRVTTRGGVTAKGYADLARAIEGRADEAIDDRADEASLAAVAARARIAFPGVVETWRHEDARARPTLMVKLPFAIGADGGVEAMWIDVSDVSDEAIDGALANTPVYATELHAGSHVRGKRSDLLDYALTWPDGKTEGGESMRILEARARGTH